MQRLPPNHTKRFLVKEVDFKNALAFDEGKPAPWRKGGPSHLVSPLCIMKYDKDKKVLVLDSLMPGVSLDQVIENTSFDLGINDREIPTYNPIGEEELHILRTKVSKEVSTVYPEFAKQMWS